MNASLFPTVKNQENQMHAMYFLSAGICLLIIAGVIFGLRGINSRNL